MTRVSGMTGMNRIDTMTTVWHKILAGSNFCFFCDFSSDPQNIKVDLDDWDDLFD